MVPAPANDPAVADALPFVTPRAWAEAQRDHTAELLVEQAHLEKKAAAAAVAFLFRLPTVVAWHRELSALGREELVHFERTLRLLDARGIPFVPQAPSPYAERLKRAIGSTMPQRLADELLVAAIIEARSCERMSLLAEVLQESDPALAAFYADLCLAEARHQPIYRDLAAVVLPAADVARRWRELGAHEAEVLRTTPWAARLHSGSMGLRGTE